MTYNTNNMGRLLDFVFRKIRFILDLLGCIYGRLFWPSKQRYLPPITTELLLLPAVELASRIKSGKLKSEDLIQAYISRCKAVNPHLNALIDDNFENALNEARRIDAKVERELRGEKPLPGEKSIREYPFLGVPFTAKNSVMAKGLTYSGGVYARKDVKGDRDSVAVERMRKVGGAIFLGLTNVPELIMWQDSFNRVDGRTNNPYDQSRIPGGSSGGEGALIASAGSLIGIGSDIAGSIRIPSHCCGIFGHKPTPRSIANEGVYPEYSLIRQGVHTLGPMCRYACDLRPMLRVLAGDKLILPEHSLDYSTLTVHYMHQLDDPLVTPVDWEIKKGIDRLVKHFSDKGAKSFQLDTAKRFADLRYAFFLWCAAMKDPSHRTFMDFLTDGKRASMNPYVELVKCALGLQRKYTASVMTLCLSEELGLWKVKSEVFEPMWQRLKTDLHALLDTNGVLLCPTYSEIAFKHNESLAKFSAFSYTALWSAMNVAITNVPMGLDRHGIPFGVQVIAAPGNDNLTIQVAEELEKQFGGWIPPCAVKFSKS